MAWRKSMDNKDKIIQEQREEIYSLNEEIRRLQMLLSKAGIPYGKSMYEYEEKTSIVRQSDPDLGDPRSTEEQFYHPGNDYSETRPVFLFFFQRAERCIQQKSRQAESKDWEERLLYPVLELLEAWSLSEI